MSRKSLSQHFNSQWDVPVLVTPQVCFITEPFLLAQTNSGCRPDIFFWELSHGACSGDFISFPSRKVGFPGMVQSCSPTSPILHVWLWSLRSLQGTHNNPRQHLSTNTGKPLDVPHPLSGTENRVFPLKTGLEICAMMTDSGEEFQAEPGREVQQEFWFQCPA